MTPVDVYNTGPHNGFPVTITVTLNTVGGSASTTLTIYYTEPAVAST